MVAHRFRLILLLALFAAPPCRAGAPVYRLIDVGFLPGYTESSPTGLNDAGVVVGNSFSESGAGPAFVWDRTSGIRPLTLPAGHEGLPSGAYGINRRGQVLGGLSVGGPDGAGGAAIWNLDGTYNFFLFGTWAAQAVYSMVQITNGGKVLGQSYWGDYSDGIVYPWIWSPERGLVDISDSGRVGFRAQQMNDRGRVVGSHTNCASAVTAVVYDIDLRLLRWLDPNAGRGCWSSGATAVNDAGDVVGWASAGGAPDVRPFIWNETDGSRVLAGSVAPGRDDMRPTSINNHRQVVGRFNPAGPGWRISLFYWDSRHRFHDLQDLLDPDDPMTAEVILDGGSVLTSHFYTPDINDRGEILVTGSLRGEPARDGPRHAFLLVPVKK